jgi:MerR family mercuric resistance operon transcriptional regulator
LDGIAGLLALEDGTHCREARALGQRRLGDVRAKLADLRRIEAVLARLLKDCDKSQGTVTCPLIGALRHL